MPITKKSRRYMTPLARELAMLHNEAFNLARRLRNLAGTVQEAETELAARLQAEAAEKSHHEVTRKVGG